MGVIGPPPMAAHGNGSGGGLREGEREEGVKREEEEKN